MKKLENLLLAVLKSLIGIALLLIGLLFGKETMLVSLPLMIIGLLVCIFSYLNVAEKIEIQNKAEEPNEQNNN